MFTRPVLKSEWILTGKMPGGVVLAKEGEIRALKGTHWAKIFSLLDEGLELHELTHRLKSHMSQRELTKLLTYLRSEGIVEEYNGTRGAEAAYWAIACSPARISGNDDVAVLSTDTEAATVLASALTALRVSVRADSQKRIISLPDYRDAELRKWNAQALEQRIPWLLIRPYGREIWVGPLFVPGQTACWLCLDRRLEQNGWTRAASIAALRATTVGAIQFAAVQAAKWIRTGTNETVTGCILSFDTADWRSARHHIARWPQCPACGRPAKRTLIPIPLERHVSPVTGLVTNISVRQLSDGLFLGAGELTQIFHRDRAGSVSLSRRMPVAGKGSTGASARVSCIGEAVERYSLLYRGDEPLTIARESELKKPFHNLGELLNFSVHQIRTRQSWNRRCGGFHSVPEHLDSTKPFEWLTARSLMNSRRTLVPAMYCLLGYGAPECTADTNGCAAGPDPITATLNALLELIERDAVAIWWYNRVRRPRVFAPDIEASFHAAFPRRLLTLIDITTDIAVPAVAAVSAGENGRMVVVGAAAHPDAHEAARKAVAEAAQLTAGVPDRTPRANSDTTPEERTLFRWWRTASLENQTYLRPSKQVRRYTVRPRHRDAEASLEECIRNLDRLGLEAHYVDQTRPEIGLPVMRVFVPGLRHPWARFGPGRLYDVPVEVKWVRGPISESDLNPMLFPW